MDAALATSALELLEIKDPELLRGVPVKKVMHKFARVLSSSNGTEDHYMLSKSVEFLDAFLSHTWNTPGFHKFLALIFHYNLTLALAISLLMAGATCILTAHGLLPSVAVFGLVTETETHFQRGVLCTPVGLLAFFISLFTLHELTNYFAPGKGKKIFLDKCCIHQTDSELKRKGIESLAGFLQCSRELLVMYSNDYFQRLWCTFEAASWLVLRRGEPIVVRPVFAPKALLGGCLAFSTAPALWLLEAALIASYPQLVHGQFLWTALSVLPFLFLAWFGHAWAVSLDKMNTHVANFQLANAKCFCEADRDLVATNITVFMRSASMVGPTTPQQEAIAKFEELVRKEVPKMIRASMGRVGIPYSWALVLALPYMLTGLDWASGWPLDRRSGWYIFWSGLKFAVDGLVVFPLICAFVVSIFRTSPILRMRVCLIPIGAVACMAWFMMIDLLSRLTAKAVSNQRWFGALVPLYGILVVAGVTLFRPSKVGKAAARSHGSAPSP